jgi:hypothetical protein
VLPHTHAAVRGSEINADRRTFENYRLCFGHLVVLSQSLLNDSTGGQSIHFFIFLLLDNKVNFPLNFIEVSTRAFTENLCALNRLSWVTCESQRTLNSGAVLVLDPLIADNDPRPRPTKLLAQLVLDAALPPPDVHHYSYVSTPMCARPHSHVPDGISRSVEHQQRH